MNKFFYVYSIILIGLSGWGGTMNVNNFNNSLPTLVLEDYFDGETKAWGMVHDRFGNLKRQFSVDIVGQWDGTTLTLNEDFVYADGELDRRVWNIRKVSEGQYVGVADDIIGEAKGTAKGNALNWQYEMNLNISGRDWKVKFDDWLFLQENGVLLNRASIKKFGIELAVVTLSFSQKIDALSRKTVAAE